MMTDEETAALRGKVRAARAMIDGQPLPLIAFPEEPPTPWDKARAARALLVEYQERQEAIYAELSTLDDSVKALEATYRKLVNAAVEHELSLAKGN